MSDPKHNVLFLCTGISARSIFGEALLKRWGQGRFQAFSAGSHPKGEVHPLALALLTKYGMAIEGLRSKSWEEFEKPAAPRLDFVFTVCDKAAAEICPAWPGQPMTAHWGIEDPAAVQGSDSVKAQAFRQAFHTLEARIRLFISLPIAKLETIELKARFDEIDRTPRATSDGMPSMHRPHNVLFLCTGNSCRSILAEATFNHLAPVGWNAMSAGS